MRLRWSVRADGCSCAPAQGHRCGWRRTHSSLTGTKGGQVDVLGERVAVMDQASIDVSGANGGGGIRVGGDYQGKNADLPNAQITYFGKDAVLKADATDNGNGGKVIVWADDITRAYGTISARGGANGGDGGFVEVSGKRYLLDFRARRRYDVLAQRYEPGTVLLDPALHRDRGWHGWGRRRATMAAPLLAAFSQASTDRWNLHHQLDQAIEGLGVWRRCCNYLLQAAEVTATINTLDRYRAVRPDSERQQPLRCKPRASAQRYRWIFGHQQHCRRQFHDQVDRLQRQFCRSRLDRRRPARSPASGTSGPPAARSRHVPRATSRSAASPLMRGEHRRRQRRRHHRDRRGRHVGQPQRQRRRAASTR
jgi:hypothetical protein